MNKEPTEFQSFKAWLFFLIIAIVGTWLIGLILGSFVAAFMYGGGAALAQATQIIRIVHYVIAILASEWACPWIEIPRRVAYAIETGH